MLLSANYPFARHIIQTTTDYILSILYCHCSHQSIILFIFANTTRIWSIPLMWWVTKGCQVLSRLSRSRLVMMVDWTTFPSRRQRWRYVHCQLPVADMGHTLFCLLLCMESSRLPIILSIVTLLKPLLSIFFLFSTATGLTNIILILFFCQYH